MATRDRQQKHENCFFDDMHSFIAAMAKRFPIHLAITVGPPGHDRDRTARRARRRDGHGDRQHRRRSRPTWSARSCLGFGPQAVRHLWEAGRLGLGETAPSRWSSRAEPAQAIQAFTEAAYGSA